MRNIDDLLTRADRVADPDVERMYVDEDADLIQELAQALREVLASATTLPGMDVVRSFEAYEKRYFPETLARRKREDETPEELGRRIAEEGLDLIRKAIRVSLYGDPNVLWRGETEAPPGRGWETDDQQSIVETPTLAYTPVGTKVKVVLDEDAQES